MYATLGSRTMWHFNNIFLVITGPLAAVLESKIGCRRLTIIGAVISSTGFGLCIISPNIQVMIVTYGFMGGNVHSYS